MSDEEYRNAGRTPVIRISRRPWRAASFECGFIVGGTVSKVYIGGRFTAIDGKPRGNFAVLNVDGSAAD